MLRIFLKFSLLLFLCLGIGYWIHNYILSFISSPESSREFINFSYKFNVGFTLLFSSTITVFSKKFRDQIGFMFLVASTLKMGIFIFIVKSSDILINKSVFLNFFIPYVLCVVLEIIYIIKIIKAANMNNNN